MPECAYHSRISRFLFHKMSTDTAAAVASEFIKSTISPMELIKVSWPHPRSNESTYFWSDESDVRDNQAHISMADFYGVEACE
jgi:hypothetical protein